MTATQLLISSLVTMTVGCRDASPPPTPPGATPHAAPAPTAVPTPMLATDSIYQSSSSWENQAGETTPLAKLAGHPLVLAMVFTRCQASCPVIMADLKAIDDALTPTERAAMRFVIFTFDAARDNAASLREFAEQHHLPLDHWALYHGNADAVRELAAMLNVRFAVLPNGGFDHANVITVLDASGVQRFQQNGLGQEPQAIVAQLRALLAL